MNSNIEKSITIEYDENIITKIKEIIKKGVEKLESFVKSKTKPDLSFYTELEKEFDEITSKLEELELWRERRYFLSIEDKILYIVYENSYNPDFGHRNFALELLEFFKNMFKTNLTIYKDLVFVSNDVRMIEILSNMDTSHLEIIEFKPCN